MEKAELLRIAKPFYSAEDIKRLEKAIEFATEKHKGQMRKSGEEYITHPLKVASFLVEWGMDIDTVVAGVLHDVVEDTETPLDEIAENFDEITIKATTPPTLENQYSFSNWGTPQTFYLPIDATAAYKSAEHWKDITGKFCEQTVIGAAGYTTFYLENENFKVPDGCTAYIITGVTPSGNIATPDNAIVKAFTAGKIIPKQTGFILQGTPNSTVVYQANVTGIEEDVTGNLLVGTATEREINGAGYKY